MQINGIPADIVIRRSRRKTLAAAVSPDGMVIVSAPLRLPEAEIRRFLTEKASRICGMLKEQQVQNARLAQAERLTDVGLRQLAQEALRVIPERVRHYAALLGVTYGKITVRNQRSRWGSCSADGSLSFNCLLMLAPPEVLDSVVVHELCHRLEMNHSKAFYAAVYRAFPEYDRCRRWLKENGALLIRRMTG